MFFRIIFLRERGRAEEPIQIIVVSSLSPSGDKVDISNGVCVYVGGGGGGGGNVSAGRRKK